MAVVPFLNSSIIVPRSVDAFLDARSIGGGPNLLGDEQVISVGAGLIRYTLSGIVLRNANQVREFRRFVWAMDGRVNTTLVKFFGRGRSPWPTDLQGRTIDPRFVRNKRLDGTPYADPANLIDSLILARSQGGVDIVGNPAAIAAAQTTSLNIESLPVNHTFGTIVQALVPSRPVAGHLFSMLDSVYTIVSVSGYSASATPGGIIAACKIRPPLREAIALGTPINFTSPALEMRFADDRQGRAPLDMLRFGAASLEFVEA